MVRLTAFCSLLPDSCSQPFNVAPPAAFPPTPAAHLHTSASSAAGTRAPASTRPLSTARHAAKDQFAQTARTDGRRNRCHADACHRRRSQPGENHACRHRHFHLPINRCHPGHSQRVAPHRSSAGSTAANACIGVAQDGQQRIARQRHDRQPRRPLPQATAPATAAQRAPGSASRLQHIGDAQNRPRPPLMPRQPHAQRNADARGEQHRKPRQPQVLQRQPKNLRPVPPQQFTHSAPSPPIPSTASGGRSFHDAVCERSSAVSAATAIRRRDVLRCTDSFCGITHLALKASPPATTRRASRNTTCDPRGTALPPDRVSPAASVTLRSAASSSLQHHPASRRASGGRAPQTAHRAATPPGSPSQRPRQPHALCRCPPLNCHGNRSAKLVAQPHQRQHLRQHAAADFSLFEIPASSRLDPHIAPHIVICGNKPVS